MFSTCPRLSHDANTDRKSFRTRFSTESRDGAPSKAASFELRSLKMVPQGLSGAALGALEWLLGCSWTLLQRSWALLRRSWGALEALLGRSWALLGAPGTLLGRSLTLWGDLGSILEPPRVDLGASGVDFGASWHRFPVVASQDRRERLATTMQQYPEWGVHYALLESSIKLNKQHIIYDTCAWTPNSF